MTSVITACLAVSIAVAEAQQKTTYVDNVLPLVEQHCSRCHNPDKKKGDLDLTTHAGALKGGGSGAVVISGNPDSSKLVKAIAHAEEPFMPPNKPPLSEKDLAVFKSWIAGGLLETSGSKAIAASKPTADLSLKVSAIEKPTGPPPMPRELPMDPVVHTKRAGMVEGLASSPWAPLLAIASQKQVLLYNTTNLDLAGILPFPDGDPIDVRFSRSGKLLLAGGGHGAKSGRVILWDVETGRKVATVGNEYDAVLAADMSPDQSKVALGGPDRLVKIYATSNGELLHKIKKHTDWVTAVAFSPDGEMLASGDRNGGVTVWDADNAQELFTTAGHKGSVTALSWRIDSKLFASSSEDSSIKLWEASEGKQTKTWNAHSGGALCVAYSREGKFVSCGRDGNVITWDANGNKVKTLPTGGEIALRCSWSQDENRVFGSDFNGKVQAWDAKSGQLLGSLDSNPSPLGERLAQAQKRVNEISARTNQPSAELTDTGKAVEALTAKMAEAKEKSERATADFKAKADVVVKLKEKAAAANPPTDINEQLTKARAIRESARSEQTSASNALHSATQALAKAKDKLAELKKQDPANELAAAKIQLERLELAEKQSKIYGLRERVAELTQQRDAAQASTKTSQEEVERKTQELKQASDRAARDQLKAAVKKAQADAAASAQDLKRIGGELKAKQDELNRLTENAGSKSATDVSRL